MPAGERKSLLKKVLAFPPAPYPFPKLFMFAFAFCVIAKKAEAGHKFGEMVRECGGNTKYCLYFADGTGVCSVTLVDLLYMVCKVLKITGMNCNRHSMPL